MNLTTRPAPLNCTEIENLALAIQENIQTSGLRVNRLAIRESLQAKAGYSLNECTFYLQDPNHRSSSFHFTLNLNSGFPFFDFELSESTKRASTAKLSPFFQWLEKQIENTRLNRVWTIPGERYLLMDFNSDKRGKLILIFQMIPTRPRLFLCEENGTVLSASHLHGAPPKNTADKVFTFPPPQPELRNKFLTRTELQNLRSSPLLSTWRSLLQNRETPDSSINALILKLKSVEKHLNDRLRSTTKTLETTLKEPDWNHWGQLLTGALHTKPVLDKKLKSYTLVDPETQLSIILKADTTLNPSLQAAEYFQNAKRQKRRIEESNFRLEKINADLSYLNLCFEKLKNELSDTSSHESSHKPSNAQIQEMNEWAHSILKSTPQNKQQSKDATEREVAKQFISKEGLKIWVGRDRKENAYVTFKLAKGNDLWLHAKGRPSAHAIIQLPKGKTASLDTLLDAANLLIHYSNGKNWGKIEVDYTFKKYVLHIPGKDPSQVRYSQNKTLAITYESDRISRLLA